jgi:uncharacterized protein YjiS (DUF1127 family)
MTSLATTSLATVRLAAANPATANSASVGVDSFVARPGAAPLPKRLADTFAKWQHRSRTRRELALLSDIDLRDIGYPADAAAEKAKPFWRP